MISLEYMVNGKKDKELYVL